MKRENAYNNILVAIRDLIISIGEDSNRKGLVDTPQRVAKMYLDDICCGYELEHEIDSMLTKFDNEKIDQMIISKDIDFYSLCEHHLLPFYGRCHIAYIPNENLVGISKISRLVEIFSHRLQMQERLTNQIAQCIQDRAEPKGVIVVMEGIHLCMRMRGVSQQNSTMITSALQGVFYTDSTAKAEFLSLIKGGKS